LFAAHAAAQIWKAHDGIRTRDLFLTKESEAWNYTNPDLSTPTESRHFCNHPGAGPSTVGVSFRIVLGQYPGDQDGDGRDLICLLLGLFLFLILLMAIRMNPPRAREGIYSDSNIHIIIIRFDDLATLLAWVDSRHCTRPPQIVACRSSSTDHSRSITFAAIAPSALNARSDAVRQSSAVPCEGSEPAQVRETKGFLRRYPSFVRKKFGYQIHSSARVSVSAAWGRK